MAIFFGKTWWDKNYEFARMKARKTTKLEVSGLILSQIPGVAVRVWKNKGSLTKSQKWKSGRSPSHFFPLRQISFYVFILRFGIFKACNIVTWNFESPCFLRFSTSLVFFYSAFFFSGYLLDFKAKMKGIEDSLYRVAAVANTAIFLQKQSTWRHSKINHETIRGAFATTKIPDCCFTRDHLGKETWN